MQGTTGERQVIPFRFAVSEARPIARRWLYDVKLAPPGLKSVKLGEPEALYIPYCRYSADVSGRYWGKIGQNSRSGTQWISTNGRIGEVRTLIFPGTEAFDRWQLRNAGDYDFAAAQHVDDVPLHGEIMPTGMSDTALSQHAHQEMQNTIKDDLRACWDRTRKMNVALSFSNEEMILVYGAAYVIRYRYGLRRYHIVINGQTGTLSGQRPIAWLKGFRNVIFMLAPAAICFFIESRWPRLIVGDGGNSLFESLGIMALISGGFLTVLYLGFLILMRQGGGTEYEPYHVDTSQLEPIE